MGLEATEVEPIPGTPAPAMASAAFAALAEPMSMLALEADMAQAAEVASFKMPVYSIFVISQPVDGWEYFGLLPRGEQPQATNTDPYATVPEMDSCRRRPYCPRMEHLSVGISRATSR